MVHQAFDGIRPACRSQEGLDTREWVALPRLAGGEAPLGKGEPVSGVRAPQVFGSLGLCLSADTTTPRAVSREGKTARGVIEERVRPADPYPVGVSGSHRPRIETAFG
jgi:hypothetical protein